jgi:hypothetical protein
MVCLAQQNWNFDLKPLENSHSASAPPQNQAFAMMMIPFNRGPAHRAPLGLRGGRCSCGPPPSLIKERNCNIPALVQNTWGGTIATSQRRFRERYPALYEDYRNSGNNLINPVFNLVNRGLITPGQMGQFAGGTEIIQSTLLHDTCDRCQVDDFLEQELDVLAGAINFGTPMQIQIVVQDLLNLLEAYGRLQHGSGSITSLTSRRCQVHGAPGYTGLSPRIFKLIREYALRILPLLCTSPVVDEIYTFMKLLYEMTGQDYMFLKDLIGALRGQERISMEAYAWNQYLLGDDFGYDFSVVESWL